MKLVELNPRWVRYEDRPYTGNMVPDKFNTDSEAGAQEWAAAGYPTEERTEPRENQVHVATLAEAQGVAFTCPKCKNHGIAVAFADRGVLDHHGSHDVNGRATRWKVAPSSVDFDTLTLSPSVDCTKGHNPNCWHGHITNGKIEGGI